MSLQAYTKTAAYFHWATAIPLIGSVGAVLKAQDIPKEQKEEKMKWMWRHKSLGLLTGLVVAPRLGYRLLNIGKYKLENLPGHSPVMDLAAKAGHLGLYGFMVVMPATGIAMGLYGGNGLPFFWTTVPAFEKKNGKLAGQSYKIHKLVGTYGKYLIPVHAGAAVGHYFTNAPKIFSRVSVFRGPPKH